MALYTSFPATTLLGYETIFLAFLPFDDETSQEGSETLVNKVRALMCKFPYLMRIMFDAVVQDFPEIESHLTEDAYIVLDPNLSLSSSKYEKEIQHC